MREGLFIGRLAKELGLNPRTIRYYESIGLLPEPERTHSGYRRYPAEVVDKLRFIKKAQKLGFTLREIKEILLLREEGTKPCLHMKSLVQKKIKDLEEIIKESKALRENLQTLLKSKPLPKEGMICPHIETSTVEIDTAKGTKKSKPIKRKIRFPLIFLIIFFAIFSSHSTFAHEPVFSLGPEVIFQGGLGIESEFEFEQGEEERLTALHYEMIYGITQNLSLTLNVPYIADRFDEESAGAGIGDVMIRSKYQFYRKDTLGAQSKFSGIFGTKLPTGDEDADPPLGTGTYDFLFGGSYGYESRTWYGFATLRYLLRTRSEGFEPGDRFFYDVAFGYRPWRREYLEWDYVFLLEMSGEFEFKSEFRDRKLPDSGGNTVWLGPTALISYRNIMFKGGVQLPVYQDLNGDQGKDDLRTVIAMEYHY